MSRIGTGWTAAALASVVLLGGVSPASAAMTHNNCVLCHGSVFTANALRTLALTPNAIPTLPQTVTPAATIIRTGPRSFAVVPLTTAARAMMQNQATMPMCCQRPRHPAVRSATPMPGRHHPLPPK